MPRGRVSTTAAPVFRSAYATCPPCVCVEVFGGASAGSFEMHRRALHVLVLVLTAVVRAGCDDRGKWYAGLRSVFKNCPSSEPRNSSGQDEFLETFRRCVQRRAADTLDALLDEDVIPVVDGVDLIRLRTSDENGTEYDDNLPDGLADDSWSAIIWNRLMHVLRTHAFKVDVDHVFNVTSAANTRSGPDPSNDVVQGRKRHRHRHRHHLMPMMMIGVLLMGTILVPMGFQFLAVLGGKALILAKMALILSSIQGLKKIATSGVNYGLYHHPTSDWHDRSHQVFPEEEERYPVYVPPRP